MAIRVGDIAIDETRLIEAGFPCHQVGAETQRERGASSALPPLYFLHVWWARRPLTPSRAAILGSLLPADTDPNWFLRELGIEKVQAIVGDVPWTLTGRLLERIRTDEAGNEYLPVDRTVVNGLSREQKRRERNRVIIRKLVDADPVFASHPVVAGWKRDSVGFRNPLPSEKQRLAVRRVAADPAHVNARIEFRKSEVVQEILPNFSWDNEDLYGYGRAYQHNATPADKSLTILDPTAGGGSIPFEALRLGHNVVANDLNPVATVILYATLDYPARYGADLADEIIKWGNKLLAIVDPKLAPYHPDHRQLPASEGEALWNHVASQPKLFAEYNAEHVVDYLYTRQVTCPHCAGEAPLLNTCWLSRTGDNWAVRIVPDGQARGGRVSFETYRVKGARGPNGENPNLATVSQGVGTCVHCRQAISGEEIRAQASGLSPHGGWQDRMYCIVADRFQPRLDKKGVPVRYKSGQRKGQVRTEKVRFFRPPNEEDLRALELAEEHLERRWPKWEKAGLIPTEGIPEGHKTLEPLRIGKHRWCDMFTPRQLLAHVTLIEELNRLKPQILREYGENRGRAIVTYLQFVIDKGVDYNSRQTRWIPQRTTVSGTFSRHDFSVKWTFGEMIFAGPNSGAAWGLSQVIHAYRGIAELVQRVHCQADEPPVTISNGSAANLAIASESVDLICMDPPYYNNVQYAELSDFYYVWQRRTLSDLYPSVFSRRLTNKVDEAVANPQRDGSTAKAREEYGRLMREIFSECSRVLRPDGVMTVMFTHKTQEAWEALTESLIDEGWTITATSPVESEFGHSQHIRGNAAAASSIFITCRKREAANRRAATWTGFGGMGVAQRIREVVRKGLDDFAQLDLNPVDEMVAGYGRALHVLSENWPVYDGDDVVSPIRAMNEASAVVAQHQIERITKGRLHVTDLSSEAAMSLTLLGIFGLGDIAYDEALNLSRSLGISLGDRNGGYGVTDGQIGINAEIRGRGNDRNDEAGYYSPVVRRGSRIRLVLPEERHERRIEKPQSEWDILHGVIQRYREGDIPVARAYLNDHAAGREQIVIDLLTVWAAEMTDEKLRREANALLFGLK